MNFDEEDEEEKELDLDSDDGCERREKVNNV